MITYKDLFKVLKAGGTLSAEAYSPTWHKLCILAEHDILAIAPHAVGQQRIKFQLHPKQVERMEAKAQAAKDETVNRFLAEKGLPNISLLVDYLSGKTLEEAPALVVLPTASETAPIPKTVQVNWSRGFSGAKYDVLGYGVSNGKRYYAINNSTDDSKPMIKRVWANECRAGNETVAIVEKAA